MVQPINQPVSVVCLYNHQKDSFVPLIVRYHSSDHRIVKIGLHHTYRQGLTLFHVFSVISANYFFRLIFNTQDLSWTLDSISDETSH